MGSYGDGAVAGTLLAPQSARPQYNGAPLRVVDDHRRCHHTPDSADYPLLYGRVWTQSHLCRCLQYLGKSPAHGILCSRGYHLDHFHRSSDTAFILISPGPEPEESLDDVPTAHHEHRNRCDGHFSARVGISGSVYSPNRVEDVAVFGEVEI